jgi:poly-gamma-glutamate capsule biosynthesis protein CapA/YwtB (metallophosphatase superfamily)
VASTANNHALDSERQGLVDTKAALRRAGIAPVGTGQNLDDARKPVIIQRNGLRFAFLAYSQYVNNRTGNVWDGLDGFATSTRPGVTPLDPAIIKEDIRRVRDKVDYVILSFHWDIYAMDTSNDQYLHPRAVAFAHEMIDAGADCILGHHPHVPRAVELYHGKPIYYCMGHLIFSFSLSNWRDNYLPRVTFTKSGITRAEVLPVSGIGRELAQPFVLEAARAQSALRNLQQISAPLGTTLDIAGDTGVLRASDQRAGQSSHP